MSFCNSESWFKTAFLQKSSKIFIIWSKNLKKKMKISQLCLLIRYSCRNDCCLSFHLPADDETTAERGIKKLTLLSAFCAFVCVQNPMKSSNALVTLCVFLNVGGKQNERDERVLSKFIFTQYHKGILYRHGHGIWSQ